MHADRLTGRNAALANRKKLTPVAECVATLGRFKAMDEETTAEERAWVDQRWAGHVARHAAGN